MIYAKGLLYVFVLLSLFFGFKSKKVNNEFFKIFLIQAFVYSILLIWTPLLKAYNESIGRINNNIIYSNIHLVIETSLLFYAVWLILKRKKEKKLIFFLALTFGLTYLYQLIKSGPSVYVDFADVIACITLTISFSIVLFRILGKQVGEWYKSPEILTIVGILLYYSASVPLISMSNYLAQKDANLYYILFHIINNGLANLRYLLLAISFIIIYRSKGKSQLII